VRAQAHERRRLRRFNMEKTSVSEFLTSMRFERETIPRIAGNCDACDAPAVKFLLVNLLAPAILPNLL